MLTFNYILNIITLELEEDTPVKTSTLNNMGKNYLSTQIHNIYMEIKHLEKQLRSVMTLLCTAWKNYYI